MTKRSVEEIRDGLLKGMYADQRKTHEPQDDCEECNAAARETVDGLIRAAFVEGAIWRNTKTTRGVVEPMIAREAVEAEAERRYPGK